MSELTDRIKSQLEQANEAVEQVRIASRGLVVKAIDQSTKAFRELIELGEAQLEAEANGGDSIMSQLSTGFRSQLDDLSTSIEQVKVASLGLLIKTKEQSTKVFSGLLEAGHAESNTPKSVAKSQSKRRNRKSSASAHKAKGSKEQSMNDDTHVAESA